MKMKKKKKKKRVGIERKGHCSGVGVRWGRVGSGGEVTIKEKTHRKEKREGGGHRKNAKRNKLVLTVDMPVHVGRTAMNNPLGPLRHFTS